MTFKLKYTLVFIIITFPINVLSQSYPSRQEIANVLKKEVENGRSNSIVVGIIDNGIEDYISYGNPYEGKIDEANQETIYEIASITKVFVTTILADLVVKGELSLDDLLIKYLPDSLKFQDEDCKKIRLKHLATHTSGLSFILDKPDLRKLNEYRHNFSYDDLILALENYQLPYTPGTYFDYSNYNMGLLAYVICKVTNKDLEALFQETICAPFQMQNTTMHLILEQEVFFATGYIRPGRPIEHVEWGTAEAGAAALKSNAQDLITFVRKLFYEESHLTDAARLSVIAQFDSTKFYNTKIGLGWFITESKNSLIVGHGGNVDGFTSLVMYDTINNRGIVVLSNSSREIVDIGLYLFGIKNINEFKSIKSKEISNEHFAKFEGTFSFNFDKIRDTIDIYKKEDLIFLYSSTVGELEMFYLGKNTFLIEGIKIKFDNFMDNKFQYFNSIGSQELSGNRIKK